MNINNINFGMFGYQNSGYKIAQNEDVSTDDVKETVEKGVETQEPTTGQTEESLEIPDRPKKKTVSIDENFEKYSELYESIPKHIEAEEKLAKKISPSIPDELNNIWSTVKAKRQEIREVLKKNSEEIVHNLNNWLETKKIAMHTIIRELEEKLKDTPESELNQRNFITKLIENLNSEFRTISNAHSFTIFQREENPVVQFVSGGGVSKSNWGGGEKEQNAGGSFAALYLSLPGFFGNLFPFLNTNPGWRSLLGLGGTIGFRGVFVNPTGDIHKADGSLVSKEAKRLSEFDFYWRPQFNFSTANDVACLNFSGRFAYRKTTQKRPYGDDIITKYIDLGARLDLGLNGIGKKSHMPFQVRLSGAFNIFNADLDNVGSLGDIVSKNTNSLPTYNPDLTTHLWTTAAFSFEPKPAHRFTIFGGVDLARVIFGEDKWDPMIGFGLGYNFYTPQVGLNLSAQYLNVLEHDAHFVILDAGVPLNFLKDRGAFFQKFTPEIFTSSTIGVQGFKEGVYLDVFDGTKFGTTTGISIYGGFRIKY